MPYRCSVRADYDAALFFPQKKGPSGRMHGHRYVVEAVLEKDELGDDSFVADFDIIQPLLQDLAAGLDHRVLNELEPFRDTPPSAERQAEYFFHELDAALERTGTGVRLIKIRITQDPDAWAEYEP